MTCICGPVFALRAVHLSASPLGTFSRYATDALIFSCFRAPQEPRPLVHDAWFGVKLHARRLDEEGYYTRAFICIERGNSANLFQWSSIQPEGYPL